MEQVSKGLANAMVDVIAIPGGFCGVSTEADGNEMALLGAAMEELVNQDWSQTEGASKANLHWRLHWRSVKRTLLYQISGMDLLCKCISLERIEAWAHGGYLTYNIRDSL